MMHEQRRDLERLYVLAHIGGEPGDVEAYAAALAEVIGARRGAAVSPGEVRDVVASGIDPLLTPAEALAFYRVAPLDRFDVEGGES